MFSIYRQILLFVILRAQCIKVVVGVKAWYASKYCCMSGRNSDYSG